MYREPLLLAVPLVLSGQYSGMRYGSTIMEAHGRAVTSFVESKGFGRARLRHKSLWNDRRVLVDGNECEPLKIQLIGLTEEHGVRYFDEREPPRKAKIATSQWREATTIELEAIAEIRNGALISGMIPALPDDDSFPEAFRLMAPITATSGCLDCHEAKEGDVIGAFAYTLIPQNGGRTSSTVEPSDEESPPVAEAKL